MERLITVKDMKERYGCSLPTARKYLRQIIPHMESPLAVTETAFREWEENRTVYPKELRRKQTIKKYTGRVIVPRKW